MTKHRANNKRKELERDARAFREALSSLLRVLTFRDRDQICCHGISLQQCNALDALARKGPVPLNALAEDLLVDKSTASRVVDALVQKGYAHREPNPESARSILVSTTEKGIRLHTRIQAELLSDDMRLLEGLSPELRRQAPELVRKVAEAASRRVEASGGTCTWV